MDPNIFTEEQTRETIARMAAPKRSRLWWLNPHAWSSTAKTTAIAALTAAAIASHLPPQAVDALVAVIFGPQ